MKNETIKTYTPITDMSEVVKLAESGESIAFQGIRRHWKTAQLQSVSVNGRSENVYFTSDGWKEKAATVAELDPCQSPDGCPDLEPWMAYVGIGVKDIQSSNYGELVSYSPNYANFCWINRNDLKTVKHYEHCAVDVRTAWSKEHFPDHCRIRAYVEPCAMEAAWIVQSMHGSHTFYDQEHFKSGWKAAMSHAIANRKEILETLKENPSS